MKKICFFVDDISLSGGLNRVNAVLACALAEDYEVWIGSLISDGKSWCPLDPRIRVRYFQRKGLRLRQAVLQLHGPLKTFLRAEGFDIVVLQGFYPCVIVSPLRLVTQAKFLFCDHGCLRGEGTHPAIARWMGSRLCHRVVTLTERNLEDYVRFLRAPRKKLRCIPNWIDFSLPRSSQYQAQSRRILAAGRFSKEKRFDLLLRVFARVAETHPDWSLDLYGDGVLMPQLRQLVSELGLEDHVSLPGMCPDLLSRYGDYAMYVLTSSREGLPLVLLEAKANRLPIVSFDVATGPQEIVRHEVDGLLVSPGDEEELFRAICRLIADPGLRERMSLRSQENLSQFEKSRVLAQWKRLLDELVPEKEGETSCLS